jgi:hypothetical protein
VNRPGKNFFACACFSQQQNRGIRARHRLNLFNYLLQGPALPNYFAVALRQSDRVRHWVARWKELRNRRTTAS